MLEKRIAGKGGHEMTRIHKKPGTGAYEKAFGKSASRMARDKLKVTSVEMYNRAIAGYFKNKTEEEKEILNRLIEKAVKRRRPMMSAVREREQALFDKKRKMTKGINLLIERYDRNKSPENAGILVNSLKALIKVDLERIGRLEYLKKACLKSERERITQLIQEGEHHCVYLLGRLLEFENIKENLRDYP